MQRELPVPEIRLVIGGHAYDTRTASVLYHARGDDNPEAPQNADQWGEVLMLNRWGHHFCISYNEMREPWDADYQTLRVLTEREAMQWMERVNPYCVEDIFGTMPEAGEGEPYVALQKVPEPA
jgi:hypothetical protein